MSGSTLCLLGEGNHGMYSGQKSEKFWFVLFVHIISEISQKLIYFSSMRIRTNMRKYCQRNLETSRMLGSIVSRLCRSSLWGSIIFICPDHFVGLFVLWSNWRLRVHVLGHFSKTIDLSGHMPRFTLNMNVFPFISLETQKCVLKPSEQCSFF